MVRIRVYNINLRSEGKPRKFGGKMECMAKWIFEKDIEDERKWDIIGLNECYGQKVKSGMKTWHVKILMPCRDITTQMSENYLWNPKCLDYHLRIRENLINSPNLANQFGDAGFIARSTTFEPARGSIGAYLGIGNSSRYGLIGIRLRFLETRKILPFYSLHMPTKETSKYNRKSCIKTIIKTIKMNWVHGDLTPLVVGDFNFYAPYEKSSEIDEELHRMMEVDFHPVHLDYDENSIDQVWTGKEGNFFQSSGRLSAVSYEKWSKIKDKWSGRKTDHSGRITEFEVP